ncbi:hypothetical protein [Microbacterium sp.]|uniref:hypothetical protein n=1 Tax=Microbacterium sp. TaxID=51671 RepID=UPI002E309E4C|nr:hypothetical protein [Microbacterium sp.]HEX5730596.1 hypothetical protein [Microbacterium sp.]
MTSIGHPTVADGALTTAKWAPDTTDDYFGAPFVDVDEWRTVPVRHRYVHGGFDGTDTLFSFYFPDPSDYDGRFFQHVTPVPQSENLAPLVTDGYNKVGFAVDSGAYFVETNGGGPAAADPFSGLDPTIGAYRANAAAARFSRVVAAELFGTHRPYGYLYGGSGGAYRTIGASENTVDVWDGFVPHVPGTPMAIPNVFSVRMHAQRILRDKFPAIVDAYDVGGDPNALDLTDEETAALQEVTRMGFPPRSWFGWQTMGMHAFSVLYPGVIAMDPTFAADYWNLDGYLGADPTASVHRDRVQMTTTIAALDSRVSTGGGHLTAGGVDESFLHTAAASNAPSTIRLADIPAGWMLGAQLHVQTGAAAGTILRLTSIDADTVTAEPGQDELLTALRVGDEVILDNSGFLAAQTYHRHQVPGPDYTVWDQFRDTDGHPIYPQRPTLLGPIFTQGTAGTLPTGQITGKMIIVACLLDREAFPWQADWYRKRVEDHLSADANDRVRLWYVDNALHGDDDPQEFPDRSVAYVGALEAALRQLAAWVEDGQEPSPTTSYAIIDGQVTVPDSAEARGGVQPVGVLTVNGTPSATVRANVPATVRLEAQAPGDGTIVELLWEAAEPTRPFTPALAVGVEEQRTFEQPGVYFISARISAQVGGDPSDPHARVQNVVRARVTVTA